MARADASAYKTFGEITDRLDEIVSAVRDKDASLERSLDLFDEAIVLGSKAVDMVDKVEFSDEELARLEGDPSDAPADAPAEGDAAATDDGADGAAGAAASAEGA